ncbi:MAG: chloride channel protein [Terriglobia bacterium]
MASVPTGPSRHEGAGGQSTAPREREFGVALAPRTALISLYAVAIGAFAGVIAEGVFKLIYFFTNLFFAGHLSFREVYPNHFQLGPWVVLIPPIGGIVAGLLIHYLEPTLKGHGTPEAMEAVLMGHSVMRTRVGILKPIASALAIGTGGPFGAEGPIIQTGAAFGAVFARSLKLSPYERRVLLGSGAAAGLAATFLAPFSGIMMAIELLLFEFSARSFIPVGLATIAATVVAICFRGTKPLFLMPHWAVSHIAELWLFALLGLLVGLIGVALIRVMFRLEDFFDRFPLKPAAIWGPVVGGFILGAIGFFFPRIFGTSYNTITAMLNDRLPLAKLLEVSCAKFWALTISLASGTTGGVFAPTLVIGGGFGAAYGMFWRHFLPHMVGDPLSYSLAGMGGLFAGSSRVPITSVLFMLELSRDAHAIMPLIVTCFVADLFVRIFNADSIMTGKLHKRGLIVTQNYSAPLLVGSQIGQVVRRQRPVPEDWGLEAAAQQFSSNEPDKVLPVIATDGHLVGIIEGHDLLHEERNRSLRVHDVMRNDYVEAHRADLVDQVAERMLRHHVDSVAVLDEHEKPIGVFRAEDLLRLRRRLREKNLLGPLRRIARSGDEPE